MCGGPLCLGALILGSNSDSSGSEVHPPGPHPHVLSDVLVSKCPHLPWLITKSFFLEPALEAPSYIAADIQPDKLTSLALPSSGLLSTGQHMWAFPHRFRRTSCCSHPTGPHTRLSLGPRPPVLSRNLGPSVPCPRASAQQPASLPHPCLDLPLSPRLMPHCSAWWVSCDASLSFF